MSGSGFVRFVGTDSVAESCHRVEQLSVDVVAVTGPMALLDVVTDCFEQVGLVEVANLHDVRGILDGDGIGLDVDDAALSVVSVSR